MFKKGRVTVPKKSEDNNKKWQLVIDFRKLNKCVWDDKFPLPNITDILDSLSGSIYFTQLDLFQGYFQAKLKPECRKYTAFTTPTGQYQMTRIPMGLETSPSAFSRLMTVAMSGLNYDKCFIYLDNIVCLGRNLDIHNKNLIDIFNRLRKVNLKLNPEKCYFLRKEILYLGHVVSANGISPDPEKIFFLKEYPAPNNSDQAKRLIAFANYYRKFIPNFAKICLPLNNLCRKNVTCQWDKDCQEAFNILKTSLINPQCYNILILIRKILLFYKQMHRDVHWERYYVIAIVDWWPTPVVVDILRSKRNCSRSYGQ